MIKIKKDETMRNDDNPSNDAHALLLFALGVVFVFSSLSKWLSIRSFELTLWTLVQKICHISRT